MDYKELLLKYQALLIENTSLREQIKTLQEQIMVAGACVTSDDVLENDFMGYGARLRSYPVIYQHKGIYL